MTEFNGLTKQRKRNCLICASGSVASLKIPELVVTLSHEYNVYIACTEKAVFFLDKAEKYNSVWWEKFLAIDGWNKVLIDDDEFSEWETVGDSVLHIELRRWADIIVVAPASADLIAKASYGIADNLVLSIMRAWDYSKPCIICPAMNTMMWEHPATRNSLNMLVGWGWNVVNPMKKVLACKEEGQGALAPVSTICQTLNETATIEVPIEAEAAHPPFHIKSTALSRRKRRDARFNRLFNILKGLFFGCLGIPLARGLYTIHKNFSLGPLFRV